jgi:uncharacterized membrane protein YfcA
MMPLPHDFTFTLNHLSQAVLGTSFAAISIPAAVATASYYRLGLMNIRLVPPLVGGAILGAGGGAHIAAATSDEVLRWGFAIVFFVLGIRFLKGPLTPRPPRRGPVAVDRQI